MKKEMNPRGAWICPLLLSLLLSIPAAVNGQAISNPNQIVGTIELTNTDVDVLAILEAGGDKVVVVKAASVGVSPPLVHSTSFIPETVDGEVVLCALIAVAALTAVFVLDNAARRHAKQQH